MRFVITTGKTVEDAILAAAIQLAVQRDKLEIEILEEPVKGLFGVFGGKDAKIRASVIQTMGEKPGTSWKSCLREWVWKQRLTWLKAMI